MKRPRVVTGKRTKRWNHDGCAIRPKQGRGKVGPGNKGQTEGWQTEAPTATVTQTVSTPPVKRHIVKKDKNKDQPYATHKKLTLNIKTNEK